MFPGPNYHRFQRPAAAACEHFITASFISACSFRLSTQRLVNCVPERYSRLRCVRQLPPRQRVHRHGTAFIKETPSYFYNPESSIITQTRRNTVFAPEFVTYY